MDISTVKHFSFKFLPHNFMFYFSCIILTALSHRRNIYFQLIFTNNGDKSHKKAEDKLLRKKYRDPIYYGSEGWRIYVVPNHLDEIRREL